MSSSSSSVLTGVIQLVAQVQPPKTTVFIINAPIQLKAHMRVYSSYLNMIWPFENINALRV